MAEPLSYKELENIVKELRQEKQTLASQLIQKEEQLLSAESLYKQIIDNIEDGVFVIQGEKFRFINQEALRILQASRKDIENAKFSEILHPEYRGDLIQKISEIVESRIENFEIDGKLISFSGKIIHVHFTVEKLPLKNSQTTILIRISDTTDKLKQEEEYNKLKQSYSIINNHTNDVLVLLEKNNEITNVFEWPIIDINKVGTSLLQINKSEIVKQPLNSFFSVDIEFDLNLEELFTEDFEVFISNYKKYFKIKFSKLNESQIVLCLKDINDLYVTKEQLNRNLQRNELFTEILRIFNLEVSYTEKYQKIVERIIYHFKPFRLLMFEHVKDAKKGQLTVQYALHEDDKLANDFELMLNRMPSWIKTLQDKKMMLGFSLSYLPEDVRIYFDGLNFKNAYIFPLLIDDEVRGALIFESQPKFEWDNTEINYLKMVTALISNLASQKNYEEKLVTSKEKAEQADRLKSSFLASMSHDIRIPMTAIIGFSDLLADPDLTIGEREEFVELISKSGQDLLTLVDNIVDVAKIETGQLKLQTDFYSITHVLEEIFNEHNDDLRLLEFDDLELVFDMPEAYKALEFETDVFRFKQVFNNLIDNALKFTDNGVIHFGVSNVYSDKIEFYVQDTGIGIAEETQHIIFERFSKIDRSYTKEYSGTGLGLSICKSLVELLKGEIRVVSYPGKGSTFYFTHPIPKNSFQPEEQVEEEKSTDINWADKTILIAEDVEQNYKVLEYILSSSKAKIVWMKNGREAVEYIQSGKRPDVILMDIRMPVLNGIDATKEILKISKNLPIIAQTAYTLGVEKDNAIESGCVGYLSKPINSTELLGLLTDIFAGSSLID